VRLIQTTKTRLSPNFGVDPAVPAVHLRPATGGITADTIFEVLARPPSPSLRRAAFVRPPLRGWLAPAGCASRSLPQRGSEGWCPESGSNRHGCYPQDFESSASANSAIRAWEEMRTVVPDRKLSTEFSRGPGAGRSVKPDLDFTAGRGCALRSLGEAARKQRKGILR
jgi:hypothetical protein